MDKVVDFSRLKIKLASPETVLSWSKGEVIKPETINYRTLKPEKDGLFCERIFGPTKDWECYCGKYKRIRYRGIICDRCGVEVTQSRVRRERMGHINLASPVAHIWYFKGAPSKLSLLLDISPRDLEAVIYFAQYLVIEVDKEKKKEIVKEMEKEIEEKATVLEKNLERQIKQIEKTTEKEISQTKKKIKNKEQQLLACEELKLRAKQKIQGLRDELILEQEKAQEESKSLLDLIQRIKKLSLLTEDEYFRLATARGLSFLKVGMGAEVLLEVIKNLDLEKLLVELRQEVKESTGARHIKATKRLILIEGMKKAEVNPAWMILQILPVIPPDLRPMVQLAGGRFATSDLNDLYRRIINRNNRLKHLIDLGAPQIILRNEKRMLQEAVDSLIDASKSPIQRLRRQVKPSRCLSDILRGKQGRFRQNLLGKRVDYSGRSVIVVGPELKLTHCGLPKEMALEMFKPFVLRELILSGMAPNVKSAKYTLEHRPPEVFDILEKITKDHLVLLNRAPTLHKLGIQAFYPILVEGNAIRIHPCVCKGYNADFDGDQMAVHVPLGKKSQEEAAQYLRSDNNLLKPADGSPVAIPDKEMALGCYYLTSIDSRLELFPTVFISPQEAILAYQEGKLELRQPMKVYLGKELIETTIGRIIFNEILPDELSFVNDNVRQRTIQSLVTRAIQIFDKERIVKLIDDLKDLGFYFSTQSGLSVGIFDCKLYPDKEEFVKESNKKADQLEHNLAEGLITEEEKKRLVQEIWRDTADELADLTWHQFEPENSIRLVIEAGLGRTSKDQVKQLSAMQGLVVDPLGRIVELPIKSNYREGLSVFEYVTSARGSRKGLADTALKTSDAGYLTRRLVDAVHDLILREEDCKTKNGLLISREKGKKRAEKFFERVKGRVLAAPIIDPKTKKVLLKKDELITEENIGLLERHNVLEVMVRSPLTCESHYGLCAACYGWDTGSKKMAEVGSPVGVLAAQSIGEPGTQLTLRTKHFGGIVVSDVTQGLPRVEEIFEARLPKVVSPLAEISGRASIVETEDGYKVRVKTTSKPIEEKEYLVPLTSKLNIEDGQLVGTGIQLAAGVLDIKDILQIRGLQAAQEYLIEELQGVYESQGIPIHDKHFEVIVRRMSDKVRVETSGDTTLLPGEFISKAKFEEENARVLAEGGEPSTAQVIILGLTRVSLYTDSWLSAASFQETTNILTEASLEGKEDKLIGLKENVIIGRLIPVTPERARIEG
ncbi:DNA-directed RNA polymerase subunit beta' [Candidatus Woesebacteria bacterium CG_4_10_14_0_2_um_filter_39_14]|uniref:DNA-directed RNA polymerase subunit beta' n=2 Tax=Microgenomates group TaxID=1794810 RepID=A0A2M7TK31_9BACT|nr:MAG: DNA-directed RNA polymerase subunit beta' [Candidatus Woesebacteria bacterium CG_4_10_14_0_2_um_filter_39_14]